MLGDAEWTKLKPLIEACRPKGKTAPLDLRRTITAILWRHQNGAKWRSIPAELGPWARGRLRPSSAGRVWVSGSACCGLRSRPACNSG
jgi:transposase